MAEETIATTTTMSDKIRLNPPTPFTGKQSDFILFMQDVFVYLKVNKGIYNDDDKKISFILSYLTGGDAAVRKQQFIQTKIKESINAKTDKPDWGSYNEFLDALKKTF
jgi:fructose-bisphosphate aldolase class 1